MDAQDIEVARASVDAIAALREEYRRELDCQIVHDSYHSRGFTDTWLLKFNGETVGYGSTAGDERDTVKEFYVVPASRPAAMLLFRALVAATKPAWIEAQTNDPFLVLPLFEYCRRIEADRVLFADAFTTHRAVPGVALKAIGRAERRRVFPHTLEPVGDWGLELPGEIVATGGLMYHYNPPYADIYMEVSAAHRRRGLGSHLVQELKRIAREQGNVPAARCDVTNVASQRTLERAGMLPCGHIVRGRVRTSAAPDSFRAGTGS